MNQYQSSNEFALAAGRFSLYLWWHIAGAVDTEVLQRSYPGSGVRVVIQGFLELSRQELVYRRQDERLCRCSLISDHCEQTNTHGAVFSNPRIAFGLNANVDSNIEHAHQRCI